MFPGNPTLTCLGATATGVDPFGIAVSKGTEKIGSTPVPCPDLQISSIDITGLAITHILQIYAFNIISPTNQTVSRLFASVLSGS